MSPLLSAVLAVLLPLNPDAEQTRVAALFAKDVETTVTTSAQSPSAPKAALARQWRGAGCRSGVEVALPGLPPLSYDIDWSRARVAHEAGARTVTVEGASPPTRVPVTAKLAFRFADVASAGTAALAMTRIRGACTPQR